MTPDYWISVSRYDFLRKLAALIESGRGVGIALRGQVRDAPTWDDNFFNIDIIIQGPSFRYSQIVLCRGA
ncbi:hypothetical protein LIA77_02874 [Sarocladium implicatum]|nr:hypothetical protein LIA77_02874 [Sarocladium implicatum]